MKRPKVFFLAILSSTAAGLRVPFYLAATSACKEKVYLRLGTGFASGITWGFFPFCQQLLFAAAHKPAPQERGDCSFQSQTPLAAAPLRGLPARYLCGCRHRSAVPTSTSKYPSGGNQSRLGCSAWICFVPRTDTVQIKTATQSSGRLTPPAAHNLVNVCVIFEHLFIC